MSIKVTKLSDIQLDSFKNLGSAMGSLATLPMPGTYPAELKQCGVNERGTSNPLVGYVATRPSGSQLALETVFFDPKDGHDNGDLHVVNFELKEIASHYRGWGTWTSYYGDNHWEDKNYLRVGSLSTDLTKK